LEKLIIVLQNKTMNFILEKLECHTVGSSKIFPGTDTEETKKPDIFYAKNKDIWFDL